MSSPGLKLSIDCSSALAGGFFAVQDFQEFLQQKLKVGHLRNNLAGKIVIGSETPNTIDVLASTKYSKRALRYYARKFLKKQGLRERFRVIATSKADYELRPYRVSSDE
jgi:large subunit ribosomal protein L22e